MQNIRIFIIALLVGIMMPQTINAQKCNVKPKINKKTGDTITESNLYLLSLSRLYRASLGLVKINSNYYLNGTFIFTELHKTPDELYIHLVFTDDEIITLKGENITFRQDKIKAIFKVSDETINLLSTKKVIEIRLNTLETNKNYPLSYKAYNRFKVYLNKCYEPNED